MPAPLAAVAAAYAKKEAAKQATAATKKAAPVALLVVVFLFFGISGPGTQASPVGQCGPGAPVPAGAADLDLATLERINALKAEYERASQTSGVSWAALAALDYRENNNAPDRSALSGEIVGATNPDSGAVTTSKQDSLVRAGEHLKGMGSGVYGVTIGPDTGGEDIQKAFLAYNRGSIYQRAGGTPNDSPYVMSRYDAAHDDMTWPPYDPLAGGSDARYGAFTIFTRLGGATASGGCSAGSANDVVRIAAEQLGSAEVPDGCNCGPEIQRFLGSSPGEFWCADFVSWVYREAGRPFTGGVDGGWRLPGVAGVKAWLQDGHQWFAVGSAEAPQPGDAVVLHGEEHVGIVDHMDGQTLHTIEGNTSNTVARREYSMTSGSVVGWGRP